MENKYDVIVIGGGTAGLSAYRQAKSLGKKALIIEANDFVTTCANVGCMPSKLLIAAAENYHEISKSAQFGISVKEVSLNDEVLWSRVRSERDRFVNFVKKGAEKIDAQDKIIGRAKFIDLNTIEVNREHFQAKSFVIATGSHPFIPSVFHNIKGLLTNENVFELTQTPKSLAVIGAGVIGLELGFAFKNLGTKVTLFHKHKEVLRLSKEINDYIVKDLQSQFDFRTTNIEKVKEVKNGYEITTDEETVFVEKILIATGRKPNIDNVGLNKIIPDALKEYNRQTTQIGHLPLFLAGDVNQDVTLLHEAAKEGVIAGTNASNYPHIQEKKRDTLLAIAFTHPQIAQVGETYHLPNDVIKGTVSFEDQGRSRVMLRNKGMLNIYYDRQTHLLLAAEMYGPDAEHIAHSLVWLIEKQTTLEEMLNFPYYHPVIEEGLRTAVRDAALKS